MIYKQFDCMADYLSWDMLFPELVGCLAGPGQQGRVGFGQLLHAALLPLRQPFAEQLPVGFVYGQHGGPLV